MRGWKQQKSEGVEIEIWKCWKIINHKKRQANDEFTSILMGYSISVQGKHLKTSTKFMLKNGRRPCKLC